MTASAVVAPVQWPHIVGRDQRAALATLLLRYTRERRWYRAKAREPQGAEVLDVIPLDENNRLAVLRISYAGSAPDLYAIPLAYVAAAGPAPAEGDDRPGTRREPAAVIARLGADGADGALIDGLTLPGFAAEAFMRLMLEGRTATAPGAEGAGTVSGETVGPLDGLRTATLPAAKPGGLEQTNSTVVFGDRALLKVYRQLTVGPNPELEMGRYLASHCEGSGPPQVLGALTYQPQEGGRFSLGIVHEFMANEGDALSAALAELRAYFARVLGQAAGAAAPPATTIGTAAALERALASENPAPSVGVGRFGALAVTLGRRTAQLHLTLARAGQDEPDFVAEPLGTDERRQLAARAEAMLSAQLNALATVRGRLSAAGQELSDALSSPRARQCISAKLERFGGDGLTLVKTRTHGDLHLGQVLVRGDDFIIIDFEGEPARPLEQRRAKGSPLRDVMGMVRSLAYAPEVLLRDPAFIADAGSDRHRLEPWAAYWTTEVTVAYLRGYLTTVNQAVFVPRTPEELQAVLTFYELEKVIYEVAYELNNRPDWAEIPLRGLAAIALTDNGGRDPLGRQAIP